MIQILSNAIYASVLQSGLKSEFFKIQRACKQGDPIAAYLFIIGGQILNYLMSQNIEIKGLVYDCEEIKLCQFAVDITLLLNGSKES